MFPLQHYRHLFSYNYDLVIEHGEYWRLLTSRLAFQDIKDVALCAMLIYNFRFLERRFGSHKYVSYLLAVSLLSALLEVGTLITARRLDVSFSHLPTGPFCLVFPQFVQFYLLIPRVATSSILGVPVTGKTFTYILGLQLASCTAEYRLVIICALLASLLWQYNIMKVQSVLFMPEFVSETIVRVAGWLLDSPPPRNAGTPMGATLELQRQERLERMEEQMVQAALRNSFNAHNGDVVRPQPLNMANGPGIFGNFSMRDAADQDSPSDLPQTSSGPVSEDQVHRLTEMGFSDESVRRALQVSNNDISQATNILLHET